MHMNYHRGLFCCKHPQSGLFVLFKDGIYNNAELLYFKLVGEVIHGFLTAQIWVRDFFEILTWEPER